ncbi:small cell adhesion glycoprotein [Zalophus californianus]|uniref:Small cell adhesion glycoprotein n=1 Tax=Zalophus californianus TaxID=9704 RepID=A0A6J2CZU4_ZALCA|nr:small cell adhesion glycoprotein [Zalophus californianus]
MGGKRTDPSYPSSDPTPSGASGRRRKRLRVESKVTVGQGKAAFPPGGAEAAGQAEGTCRGRFLSSFPVPPSRPVPPPPLPAGLRRSLRASVRGFLPLCVPRRLSANLRRSRPRRVQKDARSGARALPRPPVRLICLSLVPNPLAAMTSLLTTPSPGEELVTTPILQATEALSPEAEASTALIAVVITVVFLTLLSVVVLIFFYLYKDKGSYVTYEPAEGEPSAILQMESDSAKGRDKEEYFI